MIHTLLILAIFCSSLISCEHTIAEQQSFEKREAASEETDSPSSTPDVVGTTEKKVFTGPAATLLIDGSIHQGIDWNGAPTIGVWGEVFEFRMENYPITWAMALAHASLLLQSRGVHYSPNAVLSVAIKESRLECMNASFPNDDGCFQIEDTTAYAELAALFPDRFAVPFASVISGEHFETSALALVYYTLFSMSMFHLHHNDPYAFFDSHPDPRAQQKVISAAYNRGLWWEGLRKVFSDCAMRDVTGCFEENGTPHLIATDHANAIADYTAGLERAEPFNVRLTKDDLIEYWMSIAALYPDADETAVLRLISGVFEKMPTISFQEELRPLLEELINLLPPLPTHDEVTAAVCRRSYLWTSPPCP